ncbi:MAG: hypothetical protein A2474_00510 [Elusimicrobia bacterium RIFOXYC2_FULL_34_12]|nr:MAG: hypothetical protein A2474_00510 [Elusimicrobia bacterium RIFOXYC2_FULL_34_12]
MIIKYLRLFLISFVALFFQVTCIRWFNSNVVMLSYFSNFVLLACFLGLGVGLMISSKKSDYINYFPAVFLIICIIFWKVIISISVKSDLSIYFTASGFGKGIPLYDVSAWWFLPAIFLLTTVLFITIGQELGRAFIGIEPLKAYLINVFSSIIGVVVFAMISFFNSSPLVWFSITFVCLLPFFYKKTLFSFNIFILFTTFIFIYLITKGAIFSPYYRIDFINRTVVVNGIPHQRMIDIDKNNIENKRVYEFPYKLNKKFKKVLILGAGTGNDVAIALKNNVESIDAVEIDPTILKIGNLHPNNPYGNKNVRIFNDDARSFLKKSNEKYDLIVFALLDSLTVFSQFSSVRLENFVFTKDSFEDVKKHLNEDGVVVIYNQFRKLWIVERIAKMLEETFDGYSIVYDEPEIEHFAVIFNGPGKNKLDFPKTTDIFIGKTVEMKKVSNIKIKSTTDNWPFLYMEKPAIPKHYTVSILLILIFTGILIFFSSDTARNINNHFFFLGCGFMILETAAIIRMALLLGSTWFVNAIVIISALSVTFSAALFTKIKGKININKYYILLFISIILNIIIPLKAFLIFPYFLMIFMSSLLLFAPVFFSGTVFSYSFSQSTNPPTAFGSNLIGAMLGGCLEYISLKFGYSSLMIILLGVYLVSIKNFNWKFKK